MKTKLIMAGTLVLALGYTAGFLHGRARGRATAFKDGAIWVGRSADMAKGLRAIALLQELEQQNYTRVSEALNHDLDYAILNLLDADEYLANTRLPRDIQRQEEAIQHAFKKTGVDGQTGYRHLAEFRMKHPSKSRDKDVLEAVGALIAKHK